MIEYIKDFIIIIPIAIIDAIIAGCLGNMASHISNIIIQDIAAVAIALIIVLITIIIVSLIAKGQNLFCRAIREWLNI